MTERSEPAPEAHTYRPLQHAPPDTTQHRAPDTGPPTPLGHFIHIPNGQTPDQPAAVYLTISHTPTPTQLTDEQSPQPRLLTPHAHDSHALAGLPYRLEPGERTNGHALLQPSTAAVGRSVEVVEALAGWLHDQGSTDVELAGVSIHLVEDAAGVAQLDARGWAAETTQVSGQTRIYLGPAAFDAGLPMLAKVVLHESARVAQLRRGETDPHDPHLYAEAEAAGLLAARIDWETVAVDGATISHWAGRASLSGPRSNASVAADPATLPPSAQTARELSALLGWT